MFSRKLAPAALALTLGLFSGVHFAMAGHPVSYLANTDTAFSLGIQYDFGDMQTELVAGVRRTKTDIGNDVTGAKVDLSIPVTGDNHTPTVRVMGLAGSTNVQGEFGLGYDFGTSQPMLSGGVQGPYVNGGANFALDGKLSPYIGVNTLADAPGRINGPL